MSRLQIFRLAAVSIVFAAIQVAGFDRFLLFGVAYLALPVFVAVAVGARLPFTNAALAGALIGASWDLLSIDLFGRYGLALAMCSAAASVAIFGARPSSRVVRISRRALATAFGMIVLVVVSAISGEVLPALGGSTVLGLIISVAVGTLVSGSVLNRVVMPTRTIWDPVGERSTEWADRRTGLHPAPVVHTEREAA